MERRESRCEMSPGWIAGPFIGSGSFGTVTVWNHLGSGEKAAIKACHWPAHALPPETKEKWDKEKELMTIFNCENIVKTKQLPEEILAIVMAGDQSGIPPLCTEFCSGGNLRQLLLNPVNINGLNEYDIRIVLADVKNAVNYLHNNKITHTDIKPENIVLCPVNRADRNAVYKLTDLGQIKTVNANNVTRSATSQYFAPEIFFNTPFDHKVDYWSLGIVVFEIICGVRPFLPNKAPAQWLLHLKNKESTHICATESWNSEIQFLSSIFPENRISDVFGTLIQNWLPSLLEWEPQKRGNVNGMTSSFVFNLPKELVDEFQSLNMSPTPTQIFASLDNILAKKILTIFSVPTCEFLSYEINENTLFAAVQNQIHRDTKIRLEDQLFITSKAEIIDVNGFALNYHDRNLSVMIYLHQKGTVPHANIQSITFKIPPKIQLCLENPRMELVHFHQHELLCNVHHLIYNVKRMYSSLIDGANARIQCLESAIVKLSQECDNAEKFISKLIEKQTLLTEMMTNDEKELSTLTNNATVDKFNRWTEKSKNICEKIDKMNVAWTQLKTRLDSVSRRRKIIGDKEIFTGIVPDLDKLLDITRNYITSLRSMSNSDKVIKRSCMDAVKFIYKCFKIRDQLLFNLENQKLLQIIMDIHNEVEKMNSPIVGVGKYAEMLSTQSIEVITERQGIMWELFRTSCDEQPKSLTNFKIGESVRCPKSLISHSELRENTVPYVSDIEELETLISVNNKLMGNSKSLIKISENLIKEQRNEIATSFSTKK